MKLNLFRYLPVVVWMCLIFFFSSRTDLPSGQTYEVDFLSKKLAHVVEFFILNLLWFRALGSHSLTRATLYSLIFAFVDEIHQLFIPGRTGLLRDVGIDFIGIVLAALFIIKYPKWKNYLFLVPAKTRKK